MGKIKIIDKTLKFISAVAESNDRALNKMSADTERKAKQVAPHEQGPLHSSGMHYRRGVLSYRVVFNKEYAEYQERGARKDGSRPVKKYSKPGKRAHYLEDSAREVTEKGNDYFRNEGSLIRI